MFQEMETTTLGRWSPPQRTWLFMRSLTWSLTLEEGVLLEEAMEAGLFGASFFGPRALSSPFSGGEWAGLTRGVARSWQQKQALTASSTPGPLPLTGGVASTDPELS